MACDPAVMDLEAEYLAALEGVTGFETGEDGTLLLTGDVDLSFTAEVPLPLVGTAWRATSIAVSGGLTSPIAETAPTALFDDGTISGSDGCNQYHGDYEVSDDSLTVGMLASTQMACEPDVAQQASDFTSALNAAGSFEISGGTLTIMDGAGATVLVFDGSA
jgi:heat shock protein HslJ